MSSLRTPPPATVRGRAVLPVLLAGLVTLALAPLVWLGGPAVTAAVGACVAATVVVAATLRPAAALVGLVVVLGLQLPVLAAFSRLGLDPGIVRVAGFTKELLVLGVLVAGFAAVVARQPRLDPLDRVVVGYLAIVATYLALGLVGPRVGIELLARAPDAISLQAVAVRDLTLGVALLLAVRGLRLEDGARVRLTLAVLTVGGIVAGAAVVEALAPGAWERMATDVLGYAEYQRRVHGVVLDQVVVRSEVGAGLTVRAGSVLFDYLQAGFFVVLPLVLAVQRLWRRPSVGRVALVALLAGGVLATVTRSAIVAAVVALGALTLTTPSGRWGPRSRQASSVALVGLTILALATGLAGRLWSIVDAGDVSTASRLTSLRTSLAALSDAPLGLGLATTTETAARGGGPGLVAENAYLDLALQIGVLGAATFVAVLVLLVLRLSRRRDDDPMAPGVVAAIVGLAVGALFLHVWTMLETSWVLFAIAGMAAPRRGT